jgi:CobQ-like glutamine amidotransferase family enzyme/UDP-N-acetylmuramyl tripeptide synthase
MVNFGSWAGSFLIVSHRLLARTSLVAGALVSRASRAMGFGAGELIGGRVALAICPDVLHYLAATPSVVLVSGTNGKTTTTRMCAAALQAGGFEVSVSNEGSNLPPGLVSVLARGSEPVWRLWGNSRPRGGHVGSKLFAVLEVDEAWLPKVAPVLSPEVVILTNLTRDQLDRVSEVRKLSAAWRVLLEGLNSTLVVANSDDPLVAWTAQGSSKVCWVAAGRSFGLDSVACPSCGGLLQGEPWHCLGCGFSRPEPDLWVSPLLDQQPGTGQASDGTWLWQLEGHLNGTLSLKLPGSFNAANAAMALAGATSLGVPLSKALGALASLEVVSGRYGVVLLGGVPCRLLLAKNPAGFAEAFGVLRSDRSIVVGINARVADGKDTSWLWDVPFERLASTKKVIAAGERCWDLSVRLHYAEVAHEVQGDLRKAARQAAERSWTDPSRTATQGGPRIPDEVDMLLNYTAFAQARALAGDARAVGARKVEATAILDRWRSLATQLAFPRKRLDHLGKELVQIPQHGREQGGATALPGGRARSEKVVIVNVFPDLLGTYGDGGNALILAKRLQWRGIPCEVLQVSSQEAVPRTADLYCIGGGEDAPQVTASKILRKSGALKDAAAQGAVILAVCAGFQLLGESFADGEGNLVEGLGILPVKSQRSGLPRAVGELLVAVTAPELRGWGVDILMGFENHAGSTELLGASPLGSVVVGKGNAGGGLEGAMHTTVVGTYLHGPVLARNPGLADFLLSLALREDVRSISLGEPGHRDGAPRQDSLSDQEPDCAASLEPAPLVAADSAASQLCAERLAFLGKGSLWHELGNGVLPQASREGSLRQKLSRI